MRTLLPLSLLSALVSFNTSGTILYLVKLTPSGLLLHFPSPPPFKYVPEAHITYVTSINTCDSKLLTVSRFTFYGVVRSTCTPIRYAYNRYTRVVKVIFEDLKNSDRRGNSGLLISVVIVRFERTKHGFAETSRLVRILLLLLYTSRLPLVTISKLQSPRAPFQPRS